jgi:hypothetical protein
MLVKRKIPERRPADFRGQCNITQACACFDDTNEGKSPHWLFSVDEIAINRTM